MKRLLIYTIGLLLSAAAASAQTTLTGKVVDTKGNPVMGALVENADGSSTTTAFDGSFQLETPAKPGKITARYVGYNPKTQKSKDGMTIVLGKKDWWSEDYGKFAFMGVQCLLPERNFKGATPALQVGAIWNKFGFYFKYYIPTMMSDFDYGIDGYNNRYDEYTGDIAHRYVGLGLGLIYRIPRTALFVYGGYNLIHREIGWKNHLDEWVEIEPWTKTINCAELGMMLKYKKVLFNLGMVCGPSGWDKDDEYLSEFEYIGQKDWVPMVNCGVSYCF